MYAKKDDGNPGRLGKQCCARSLGSWLPTNGDDADKFCQLGRRAVASEKEIDRVKSVSDRMVNAMKGLRKSQGRLKREYRALYIAHEKTENGKKGEVMRERKELQLLEDQSIAKNAEFNGIQESISNQEDKNEKTIKDFKTEAKKIDASITFVSTRFDAAQKEYAEKLQSISDLQNALNDCKDSNKDAKDAIKELRSSLSEVKSQNDAMAERQSEATKAQFEQAAKLTQLKKKHEQEIGKIEQDQEKIRQNLKEFTEYNDGLVEEINDLQSQINQLSTEKMSVEARTEVKKAKAAASLLQVKDDGDETFDAKKYAAAPLKKDGSSDTWIDTEQKMLADASSFVKDKLSGLSSVMLNLKAIVSRVQALKRLDADLHSKIMDNLEKKHTKLKNKVEAAKKAAVKLSNAIYGAVRNLKDLQRQERTIIKQWNKILDKKNVQLSQKLKDLRDLTNLIGDARLKVLVVTAKNVKCKAVLLKNKAVKKWVNFDLGRKTQALSDLEAKVVASEQRVENLKSSIEGEISGHESAIQALDAETSQLQEDEAVAEKMADKLEGRRDDKVDERDDEQKELNHAKDELKRVGKKGRPGKRPGKRL